MLRASFATKKWDYYCLLQSICSSTQKFLSKKVGHTIDKSQSSVKTWEWIKPWLRKEFATQSVETQILDQLSHLKIKPDKMTVIFTAEYTTFATSFCSLKPDNQYFCTLVIDIIYRQNQLDTVRRQILLDKEFV